jgi:hypothetical protein
VTDLDGAIEGSGSNASTSVMDVAVQGLGPPLLNASVPSSAFSPGTWTSLSFSVTVTQPVPAVNEEGVFTDAQVALPVAEVSIAPSTSPD